ncbi:hypothetical protein RBS60_15350 [Sinomonas sp. ASV486]|uniref:Uncharacterized protein n=1 Tax=Sinomonas puerhi TaxID=3238584 RepID=A0AB39L1I3_9MICC|nr:hypothetical protein [Sinomonas sp. ASV486]MDQ4491577.1 hypothetical protein [Sinomonas sp. ASV486]
MLFRLGYRLFVKPAARIAADVASAVTQGTMGPPVERSRPGRDWWLTTLLASAISAVIGVWYATTTWPAALLWFTIALALPARAVSEGLRTVPYFLLAAVLLSTVPVVGWWLAGAVTVVALVATVRAWTRWRSRAHAEAAMYRSEEQVPAGQGAAGGPSGRR